MWGCIKVFWFNVFWMILCLLGSILVLLRWIVSFGHTDIQREANRMVENQVALFIVRLFVGEVKVVGRENLPPESSIPAPVHICNHASQLDAAVVYFFDRRFKWIAKDSVLFLPGVGLTMALSGHVLINRTKGKNKGSVSNLFEKSNAAIQSGVPMFFFPQGTRRIDQQLPFKDGAFVVAETNHTLLVPLSIDIPRNIWNDWYPIKLLWSGSSNSNVRPIITLTIHKPIQVTGQESREALKTRCMDQIYSVLPPVSESSKDK